MLDSIDEILICSKNQLQFKASTTASLSHLDGIYEQSANGLKTEDASQNVYLHTSSTMCCTIKLGALKVPGLSSSND